MIDTYYEEDSFKVGVGFIDTDNKPVTPEIVRYTIINLGPASVVRTETETEDLEETMQIAITSDDNKMEDTVEQRKVIVKWKYNGGEEGDTIVYLYQLKKP